MLLFVLIITLSFFLFCSDLVLYGRPHIPNRILHQWSRRTTVQITQQHSGGLLLRTVRPLHLLHNSGAPVCGKSLSSWLRGTVPAGTSWGVQCETERTGTHREGATTGDRVIWYNNSLNCKTNKTIAAHTTCECVRPHAPLRPNLCLVKPVLSLCCTFEFRPKGSGCWSTQARLEKTECIHSGCFQYYFTLEYSSVIFGSFKFGRASRTCMRSAFVRKSDI